MPTIKRFIQILLPSWHDRSGQTEKIPVKNDVITPAMLGEWLMATHKSHTASLFVLESDQESSPESRGQLSQCDVMGELSW